ncbi:MAG: hypothetical protein LC136_03255 [Burkholderiales bacterium]|jgi:opacity protein-like surface antigen|nr:hypothetical protein [Burkholderiales bacterium]HMM51844.1 hypothetical protein [Burkholderiaceae bacterium]
MKRFLFAAVLAAAAVPALAADVGVSVSVGQPGFYGRIDIGQFPHPVLVYPEPVIIRQAPYGVVRQPIYLRVPPGHAKDWRRYCHHYGACGQPVYFVQDRWYNEVYAPRYRESYRSAQRPPRHEQRHAAPRGRGHDGRSGHPGSRGQGKGNQGRGNGNR